MADTLTVLFYSSLAALAAALGVLPLLGRARLPTVVTGWGSALAAGVMLGAAYELVIAGMRTSLHFPGSGGALLGVAMLVGMHRWMHTNELPLHRVTNPEPVHGYQFVVVNAVHAACEGIAIGAAMSISVPFGVFMALVIAVHNIPEATNLGAVVRGHGLRVVDSAAVAVVTNIPQVLFAVVVYAVTIAAPNVLPWALGFAAGTLVYLVMAELLPESYEQIGSTTIALVAAAAMVIIALLRSMGV